MVLPVSLDARGASRTPVCRKPRDMSLGFFQTAQGFYPLAGMPSPPPPTKPPKSDPRQTPAMKQYYRFKRQHPDCLLLFRIGDFYEMFDDDAVAASRAIGLTLTQRTEGVPMAGLPFHQLETYLRRFMDAGFRVAVGEQIEDASQAKGLVQRAVTRVLTPGTLVDDDLLPGDRSAALAAVCFTGSGDDSPAVLAVADLSTGSLVVMDCAANAIADEIARRGVSELLYAEPAGGTHGSDAPPRVKAVLSALSVSGTARPSWHFRHDEAREIIFKHYGVSTLAGFGLADDDAALRPAGAILRYLHETQSPGTEDEAQRRKNLAHLRPPKRDNRASWCVIDATTLRSLEILRTLRAVSTGRGSDTDGSLVGIFQSGKEACRTAMGRRLIREWLCFPLCDKARIEARHGAVSTLISDRTAAERLGAALSEVQDVARIAGRVSLGRATPRDLCALGRSLAQVRLLNECIDNAPAFAGHKELLERVEAALTPLAERIERMCIETPPAHLRDGGLIRDGVDGELDEARTLRQGAADWMADYQQRLVSRYELPNLKVGYNKIFGYYIELPAAQAKRAPDEFTRKQTLKGAERYITPELKDFETRASSAEARALSRELALFEELCTAAAAQTRAIVAFADAAAELDVLLCFADKAHRRGWARPVMSGEPVLVVRQGRHPVLDELLDGSGRSGDRSGFVPNDVELGAALGESRSSSEPGRNAPESNEGALQTAPHLALVTGPNMAGKSTYIRQVALITLLAHAGSFVPAEHATVGLTDRIFTRLGADDALHAGQSTFMVEMTETARILHHATAKSLVVLDEIGRGTSTLDGLSLAWAIAEKLCGSAQQPGPRTLFATHYHELTDLAEVLPGRVTNLHVAVREWGEEIVFLHRILPGATDQSYGIHVAKLAGIPAGVVSRAREVLSSIAVQHHGLVESESGDAKASTSAAGSTARHATRGDSSGQLSLFTEYVPHPAVEKLREVKLEALTPLEAFDALRRLKELTDTKRGKES